MPYEQDPRNPTNFVDNDSECEYCGESCSGDFCDSDCKEGYEQDMFIE